jgi:hypothetical protein
MAWLRSADAASVWLSGARIGAVGMVVGAIDRDGRRGAAA